MLVVTNKFLPNYEKSLKKYNSPLLLATTEAGDVAYYVTRNLKNKHYKDDDDDDDDDDESESFLNPYSLNISGQSSLTDMMHGYPEKSFTGAPWNPVFNDRMTMFIAGTPGAGKSYLAKQMIRLLPSNLPILLFTALEEKDGNFSDLGSERLFKIKMTPEVLSKISLAEIRGRSKTNQSILLFDDIDKIKDSKVYKAMAAIMNDALANGRGHEKHDGKGDIHVICTSHAANDYLKTKFMFENSNYVALFPGTTPALQMYRMFDKLGLEKELCQKMIVLARQQRIRSIIIHKVVPMYMIFGNQIMLL